MTATPKAAFQTPRARLIAWYDRVEAKMTALPPEEYAAIQQKVRDALAPKQEADHAAD